MAQTSKCSLIFHPSWGLVRVEFFFCIKPSTRDLAHLALRVGCGLEPAWGAQGCQLMPRSIFSWHTLSLSPPAHHLRTFCVFGAHLGNSSQLTCLLVLCLVRSIRVSERGVVMSSCSCKPKYQTRRNRRADGFISNYHNHFQEWSPGRALTRPTSFSLLARLSGEEALWIMLKYYLIHLFFYLLTLHPTYYPPPGRPFP